MPLFLLYSNAEHDRNATGRDCAIVSGTDEADARARASAAALPLGETRIHASWAAVDLAGFGAPVFVQGRVAEPLRAPRGK